MIEYNVAGGKMNRGLTVLAVQTTFSKAHGKPLTDKVRCVFIQYEMFILYVHYLLLYHTLSLSLLYHPTPSHPGLSYPILSYPILGCPIPFYPIICYPIICYPIIG